MLSTLSISEKRIIWSFAAVKLLAHFLTNTIYTFHRDEFLYIDESRHLAWGFLEIPPLTPFLGKVVMTIAGDSVFGVRLLPALVSAAIILLIGRIVKELGGGKWAMILACLAFLLSPAFLRTGTLYQPVGLDIFWWVVLSLVVLLIVKQKQNPSQERRGPSVQGVYVLLGLCLGLGWLTKYSIAFMALAVFGAVIITRQRKCISWPHLGLALVIALALALPNIAWQYLHNFPVVTHMEELATTQLVHVNPLGFLAGQFLMQFAGVLVWLPGVIWLLVSKSAAPFRFLGWTYIIVVALIMAMSGKDYYTLGIYPVMMAAGGVAIERWLTNRSRAWLWSLAGVITLLNLPALPLGLPLLKVEKLIQYCALLEKVGIEQRWEDGEIYPIPQDYADMQAWEEIPQMVAGVYHALPPERRQTCAIYGGSYVHAGALNYYRDKYGLPEAFSLNATYILWAPEDPQFDNMIMVDNRWQDTSSLFYHHVFIDSISYPYTRDPGYVFYRKDMRPGADSMIVEIIRGAKEPFQLK